MVQQVLAVPVDLPRHLDDRAAHTGGRLARGQHPAVAGVLDEKFGDGASLADFLDGDRGGGDGLVGQLVVGRLAGLGIEREDGQRVASEWLADVKLRDRGDPVPIRVWRDGRARTREIAPGKLGVVLDREPAPVA